MISAEFALFDEGEVPSVNRRGRGALWNKPFFAFGPAGGRIGGGSRRALATDGLSGVALSPRDTGCRECPWDPARL
jgi:hypothetical protein